MAEAAPLRSPKTSAAAFALLLTAACARNAPELPPHIDQGGKRDSISAAETVQAPVCAQIDAQLVRIAADMDALEQRIHGNRADNQTFGYLGGVLFPPLLLGLHANESEKQSLDKFQAERDRLLTQRAAHLCNDLPVDSATGRIRLQPAATRQLQ